MFFAFIQIFYCTVISCTSITYQNTQWSKTSGSNTRRFSKLPQGLPWPLEKYRPLKTVIFSGIFSRLNHRGSRSVKKKRKERAPAHRLRKTTHSRPLIKERRSFPSTLKFYQKFFRLELGQYKNDLIELFSLIVALFRSLALKEAANSKTLL